jgi:hypothetical protein
MLVRSKLRWILTGLAVIVAISVCGGFARASSIGLKGHITPLPGGSPFLYLFELDLNNLTEGPITTGATLTVGTPSNQPGVSGLVGVTGLSGTQQPPFTGGNPFDFWAVPPGGIITTNTGNPPPYNQESSVTWKFVLGPSYSQVGEVGLFAVETTSDFPDNMPPVTPNVTLIDYTFTFANGTVDSGAITLSPLVPEPSSVILFLVGVGALPLVRRSVKRSRSA